MNEFEHKTDTNHDELLNEVTKFVQSDGYDTLTLFDNNSLVVDESPDDRGHISIRRWTGDAATKEEPVYVWNGNEGTMPAKAIAAIMATIQERYPETRVYYEQVAKQKEIQATIKNKDYSALADHLKTGIKKYLKSDDFKQYLNFVARFHKYSSKNNTLILAQNHEARHVASFKKWQDLGRKVSKGAKAIYVYAPMKLTKKDDQGKPLKDETGQAITFTKFHLTPVFDVSQTTGRDLPKPIYELTDNLSQPQQFKDLFKSLSELTSSEVIFARVDELSDDANGCFIPARELILIRPGMGQQQTIKTLIHETIHARLHHDSQARFGSQSYAKQEFEAEAVAYIVTNHLGIDSSDFSFGYLASWTNGGQQIEVFEDSLATITKEAQQLISEIDVKLEKIYQLAQPNNKFDARVATIKTDLSNNMPSKSQEKAHPKVTSL